MTPEQKIVQVLKQIKDEAAINPDSRLMRFNLNTWLVGAGILTDDEERRILFKLKKEGAIDLRLSQHKEEEVGAVVVVTSHTARRFLESSYYWVEILDGFERKYSEYIALLPSAQPKQKQVFSEKAIVDANSVRISGDYVAGDKIGKDKIISSSENSKTQVVLTIIAILIAVISVPWWPDWFGWPKTPEISQEVPELGTSFSSSTLSLVDILDKLGEFSTSLERDIFLEKYEGAEVYGVGTFQDISKTTDIYLLDLQVSSHRVTCAMHSAPSVEKGLLLLTKNQRVRFLGEFTGSVVYGGGWHIASCTFPN